MATPSPGSLFRKAIQVAAGRPTLPEPGRSASKDRDADTWENTANVPVPKKDLDKPDLDKIDEIWQRCRRYRAESQVAVRNALCEKYLRGETWWRYDHEDGELVEDQILRAYGVRKNNIRSCVTTLAIKANANPVRLEAAPNPAHNVSQDRAKATTAFLDYLRVSQDWPRLTSKINKMKLVFEKCFARVYWDEDACGFLPFMVPTKDAPASPEIQNAEGFEYVGRVPYQGAWIDVVYGPIGDFKIEILPLEQIYVEPGVDCLEDADRFFIVSRRTLSWFRSQYPKIGEKVRASEFDDIANDEKLFTDDEADPATGRGLASEAGLAYFKTFFQKVDGKWRKIEYVLDGSNTPGILLNPDEKEPMDVHGVVEFSYDDTPGQFYKPSLVWDLIPLQHQHDRARTTMNLQLELTWKPVLITPIGVEPKIETTALCHMIGVPNSPQGLQIQWSTIPVNIDPVLRTIEMTQRDIEEASFIQGVSRGRIPNRASGKLVDSLIGEQQVTPDELMSETLRGMAKLGNLMVTMARKFYTEPRLVNVFSSKWDMQMILEDTLPAVSNIEAQPASMMPKTLTAKIEWAGALRDLGFYDADPQRAQMMLRAIGAPEIDLDHIYPSVQSVKASIKRAINLIDTGRARVVNVPGPDGVTAVGRSIVDPMGYPLALAWQDHEAWMAEINDFRNSERYFERWSDRADARDMLDVLYEEHKLFVDQMLREQAEQMAMAEAKAQGKAKVEGELAERRQAWNAVNTGQMPEEQMR